MNNKIDSNSENSFYVHMILPRISKWSRKIWNIFTNLFKTLLKYISFILARSGDRTQWMVTTKIQLNIFTWLIFTCKSFIYTKEIWLNSIWLSMDFKFHNGKFKFGKKDETHRNITRDQLIITKMLESRPKSYVIRRYEESRWSNG